MNLAIIDYKAGNIRSVKLALERLGIAAELTADPERIQAADKVIFPGVGEASWAMNQLKESGLDTLIPRLTQPFLGICLGMQLLCTHSEESNTSCLGVFPARVKHFNQAPEFNREFKVPHMGWNSLTEVSSPLFDGIQPQEYMYFVHSYYVELTDYSIASCDYVLPFSAAMHKNNFYAVQFHPERSGKSGEQLLTNFLRLS